MVDTYESLRFPLDEPAPFSTYINTPISSTDGRSTRVHHVGNPACRSTAMSINPNVPFVKTITRDVDVVYARTAENFDRLVPV